MNLLTEQTALLQYLQNPKSYKTKYPSIFFFFFFFEITNIENLENKEVGFVYYAIFYQ